MKKETEKIMCEREGCKKEAKFFHSRCCDAHFEGIFDKGYPIIVCENCGKYMGEVAVDPKKENKKYKL